LGRVWYTKNMSNEEIKNKIKEAFEQNPFKKDIKKISLFGSRLHGNSRKDSDVDLLVEFEPEAKIGYFKYVDIQNSLGKYLGKKIDLVTPESLSKYFRNKVLNEAEIIYER